MEAVRTNSKKLSGGDWCFRKVLLFDGKVWR